MSTELFEQWVELSKGAAEPLVRLNQITARTMERLAKQQLDMARDYLDLGARQLQALGEAKDPQKLLSEEGRIALEFGQKLRSRAEEYVQLATEAQQAVAGWAEETARSATPGAKKTKAA